MIGLLNAYHVDDDPRTYQLKYAPMFVGFLSVAMPAEQVRVYGVARGEFPASTDECNAWIITGSPKSAYDQDPWITKLGGLVQDLHRKNRKLIGVCFGHQLIAHYLGGRTERSPNGWGLGVRRFQILKNTAWMRPELNACSLIFSHQDQVVELPKNADLLATDHFCPHQMYSIGSNIFCFQGHPEFTPAFAEERLDAKTAQLEISKFETAKSSLKGKTNSAEVGQWMRNFLRTGPL